MELTLPGFRHDMCSTILPLTLASPFFRHDRPGRARRRDGPSRRAGRAPARRRAGGRPRAVGGGDGGRPRRGGWAGLAAAVRPARPRCREARRRSCSGRSSTSRAIRWRSLRFGLPALRSTRGLARDRFEGDAARALFAGISAHSMLPLDRPLSACFGLVLATVRPCGRLADGPRRCGSRRGGARRGARGGGRRDRDRTPGRLARRPAAGALDDPRRHAAPARWRSPATGCRRGPGDDAERFRYGPGVFKMDWALDGPVPWAAEGPRRAATVHLGGHARRDRRVRGGRRGRPAPRPAVRAVRPVRPVGHVPGAGRARPRPGRTATCRRARTST